MTNSRDLLPDNDLLPATAPVDQARRPIHRLAIVATAAPPRGEIDLTLPEYLRRPVPALTVLDAG